MLNLKNFDNKWNATQTILQYMKEFTFLFINSFNKNSAIIFISSFYPWINLLISGKCRVIIMHLIWGLTLESIFLLLDLNFIIMSGNMVRRVHSTIFFHLWVKKKKKKLTKPFLRNGENIQITDYMKWRHPMFASLKVEIHNCDKN